MKFCVKCLYSTDHPFGLEISENGICSGCIIHEEKFELDWVQREKKLKVLLNNYRSSSDSQYDCIIPISGGGDSFFIVDQIKNKYKLNPLLVTYNKQFNTAVGIRNLARLREVFDCDLITLTVNPEVVKKLTKSTLRKFGSMYWHCIAGQTSFPVRIACDYKIPLIIWGEHQGIDQVGMFSHTDEVEMTRKFRKEHDLMGFEAEDLMNDFENISDKDLHPFQYPDDELIANVGVRGIYLGNYISWDSRIQNESMISKFGYETSIQNRTFDLYQNVDCWNYSDIHDYIKYLKLGYGKVVDHAVREIRFGRMRRAQAIEFCKNYLNRPVKNLDLFLDWLGIYENSFYYIIDQHRNDFFFERNKDWEWIEKNNYLDMCKNVNIKSNDLVNEKDVAFREFQLTKKGISMDDKDAYILIGKGTS